MTQKVNVDPAVLVQAANGIEATIGELSIMGIGQTGNMGRGRFKKPHPPRLAAARPPRPRRSRQRRSFGREQ
ncbi:hypothetical protein [Nocardia abscessus]|uniref:hypothetical protein n=1 Tax=Nocardia abscessus TaxID=120957 RepID=UPI002456E115|nr:hypothetical protein [Nocardia abscessus]